MGRFLRSWSLVKESYRVLKSTPNLAFFPVISGIACLIATISFFLPLALTSTFKSNSTQLTVVHYIVLFLFYFVTYFIVIFFNAGLVSCAHDALSGKPTTYHDGLRNASSRMGAILMWSLISATVGTVLRALSERVPMVGKLILALLGGAWSLVTYFVIPVMVIERVEPAPAIKRSFAMVRTTWGERVIGGLAMGSVFLVLMLAGFIPISLGIIAAVNGLWIVCVPLILISLLYWMTLAIIGSTLSGIFNTAVYIFASTGQVPAGFSEEYVRMAFVQKQQGRMFGREPF